MLGGIQREEGRRPSLIHTGRCSILWRESPALRQAESSDGQHRKKKRERRAWGHLPVPNCRQVGLVDLEEDGNGLGSILDRCSCSGGGEGAARRMDARGSGVFGRQVAHAANPAEEDCSNLLPRRARLAIVARGKGRTAPVAAGRAGDLGW